jgi:hypothetical protein
VKAICSGLAFNMKHALVQLAADRLGLDRSRGGALYSDNGRPGIETRFVIGLLLLKHIYELSDEGTSAMAAISNIPANFRLRLFMFARSGLSDRLLILLKRRDVLAT